MAYYRNTLLAILAVCLFTGLGMAQDTSRAMATWQVQKYDLDVTLPQDDKSRSITVKAVLNIKNISGKPATSLTLRISPAAVISAVKINDVTVDFSKSEEKINASASLQRAAIRFASVQPDALLTATVDYQINVKENSALMALGSNGSQFLPLSFWYPTPNSWYFTRGADFAPYRLKVHSAGGQTVISSGIEAAGGFDQTLYAQPFFIAGSWEMSDQNGVAVYMPKGGSADAPNRAAELASLLTEAKAFAAGIFGKAPDVKLRIVAGRRGAGFAGAGTVIVNNSVFHRSTIDSQTAMNIAEAAAKLWVGNVAAVNGDGYGVISEGLARYIATQFIESKYGKDVADIERLRQRNSYAAVSQRDSPLNTVSPLDDYYYPEVANKGAMVWRIIAKRVGPAEFSRVFRESMQDRELNMAELRAAFASQKDLLDFLFDKVTDMNLLVGLPQESAGGVKVAVRNTGESDVTVDITATTASGEKVTTSSTIRATSFGEVAFKSNAKIVKVEIDSDKLYPQTDYSDDVAPRTSTDSDPLLGPKRFLINRNSQMPKMQHG